MPLEEFWHDDIDLFCAYLKAYNRRIDTQAWLNGLYVSNANQMALLNTVPVAIRIGMSDKKLDQNDHIPYIKQPMSSTEKYSDYSENEVNNEVTTEIGYMNAMRNLNKM